MEDHGHEAQTRRKENDEKQKRFRAESQFGGERPTPDAERPTPNSELSVCG
jgi:hypothetical protein